MHAETVTAGCPDQFDHVRESYECVSLILKTLAIIETLKR